MGNRIFSRLTDPWSGSISLVEAFRIKPLDVSFNDAVATAEQLGRGTLKLLGSVKSN